MNFIRTLLFSFLLCSSSVFAETYEEREVRYFQMAESIFQKIEEIFENSNEKEKKELLFKKINKKYLYALDDVNQLDFTKLYELRYDSDRTNLLALAVSLGNVRALYEFLPYVDDINDSKYWVWGYRQFYTMAHLILDPQYPVCSDDISLETRLRVIDLFVQKGINFDIIPSDDIYRNPAIAGGNPRGKTIKAPFINEDGDLKYKDIQDELRVRALLAGADPTLSGTSFGGLVICTRPFQNGKYHYDKPLVVSSKGQGDIDTGWAWRMYLKIMSKQIEQNITNLIFRLSLHPQLEAAIKE